MRNSQLESAVCRLSEAYTPYLLETKVKICLAKTQQNWERSSEKKLRKVITNTLLTFRVPDEEAKEPNKDSHQKKIFKMKKEVNVYEAGLCTKLTEIRGKLKKN